MLATGHLNYSQISVLVDLLKIERTQKISDTQKESIKMALTRVEAGKYGNCQECNNNIYYKELLNNPARTKCISCDEKNSSLKEKSILAS